MNNSNTNVILTPRKAILFCLIVYLLYLCTLKNGCEFWNIDGLFYLTLAKSLISLGGYKILGISHTLYPFGFPCLLVPIVGIFGYNFLVINIFLLILAVLALSVCFILFRRSYNGKTADLALLLTGIAYFFWNFSCNWIISDIPYFLLSLLALIMAQKYFKSYAIKDSILLAFLILASYFTRTIGISLLGAVVVLSCKDIIKKRQGSLTRLCIILFICGSAIFAWFAREKVLTTTTPTPTYKNVYDSTITKSKIETLRRIKGHFVNHSKDITSTLTSIPKLSFNLRFWWYLICLTFISGFIYNLFKRSTIIEWYLLFYIGVLIAWPSESVRFWYPVTPFIFFYFLEAIYLVKEKLSTGNVKILWRKIGFLILLFVGYFLVFIPLSETQHYESGLMRYYQMLITFVFVMLYFFLVLIVFINAFRFENSLPFIKKNFTTVFPYLWKITFAIIVLHNLSMIAHRTYLKHQDYGLKWAGKLYLQEMGQWLRQHSNKNDVIMCDDPITVVAIGVFSERSCIPFPGAKAEGPDSYFWGNQIQLPGVRSTQGIIDKIQKENVSYVLIENNKKSLLKNLREIEVFNMIDFKEILQVEGNMLFKIESRQR